MARRREPSARSILRALKIEPLRELAQEALKHEVGTPERLAIMRELIPYTYAKPRAPIEAPEGTAAVVVVEIGGED